MTDHVQLSPTDWVREQTEQILEQGTTDGVLILDRPVVLFTVTGAKSGQKRQEVNARQPRVLGCAAVDRAEPEVREAR